MSYMNDFTNASFEMSQRAQEHRIRYYFDRYGREMIEDAMRKMGSYVYSSQLR